MRVVHVHSGNLYGGIETLLVTLARCRDLCPSMEPHFALCFQGRLSDELLGAGVPVHELGEVRARHPFSILRARRRLTEIIRKHQIDIAICHSTWSQAILSPAVRDAGAPLIFWFHDTVDGRHWLQRWTRLNPPDFVLCNSRFTQATLRNLYTAVPNTVIYYPVSWHRARGSRCEREDTRRELRIPSEATVIVQTSRMEAWKGHKLLLQSLELLKDTPGWVACIAGGAQRLTEARYLDELKDDVANRGILDRVIFVGQCSNIPQLLEAADIHCQPNLGPEPFGISFIEALCVGIPVVTTAIGGAREIVSDCCGILVPPEQPEQLSRSLARLIEDRELRQTLGSAGPTRARELCDPQTQMSKIFNTLKTISERVN
jgi:glycosyltransferase involved in cell wall biosynthesis